MVNGRVVYNAGRGIEIGCGGRANGGVVVSGGFFGSPAAVAQAKRRAAKNGDGGSYAGMGYGDAYVVNQSPAPGVHKRKLRRRGTPVYCPPPGYYSGVVVHYGPAIIKNGGY